MPLVLTARHDFQLFQRNMQPTLPGPLGDDFGNWDATPEPLAAAPRQAEQENEGWLPDPESVMRLDVGNEPIEFRQKRLRVLQ